MLAYVARRLVYAVGLLIGISMISFTIIQLPPGDYLSTYVTNMQSRGLEVSAAQVAFLKQQYGLDLPVYQQYFKWAWNFIQGDFGYSFEWQQSVSSLIRDRLLLTVIVSLATLVFTWLVAFPIGVYTATHQYSAADYIFTFIGFIGLSIPSFLLALLLAYAIFKLTGVSVVGLFSPEYADAPWSVGRVIDLIKHIGLPIFIVGASGTASLIRTLRACILDELGKPYVVAARARGLKEIQLLFTYPIRIAVNPLLSTVGWLLPGIISGTVIIAVVLGLDLTGPLLLRSLQFQDMYLAASFVMLLSALTVVGTFISDILLAWSDPRIRILG